MKAHPTNPALEAAIIAHADEDTPRLVYADWLDENGDPDRAEFIRVQCRLAEMSPAEPQWVDLIERQDELVARLRSSNLLDVEEPDRFYFGYDFLSRHEEPFRRGFPYFIDCQTSEGEWNTAGVNRVIKELTRLVATTTIRGFHPYSIPMTELRELLAAPVAAELTGLALMTAGGDRPPEIEEFFRLVATSPTMRRVRHLALYGSYAPVLAGELAKATALDSVRRLTIHELEGSKSQVEALTKAAWFRRLHHFRAFFDDATTAPPLLAGVGKLPELHTLEIIGLAPGAVAKLAAGKFPALGRLVYGGPLGAKHAKTLAGAKFPSLAVFEAGGGLKNDGFAKLLKAKWFSKLRVLDLEENSLGDQSLKALAAHPVAKTLRVLKLGDNSFGPGGLAALATPGAFPALTTLNLHSHLKRKGKPAQLAAWLASLHLPELRHLDLMGWPLANLGAKALAANPSFANLTRLNLESCEIGDPGAQALFASPHLQNLVELELSYNNIKTGADALAKPTVMPRLGECRLSSNKIPQKAAKKLERDGLYLIT